MREKQPPFFLIGWVEGSQSIQIGQSRWHVRGEPEGLLGRVAEGVVGVGNGKSLALGVPRAQAAGPSHRHPYNCNNYNPGAWGEGGSLGRTSSASLVLGAAQRELTFKMEVLLFIPLDRKDRATVSHRPR